MDRSIRVFIAEASRDSLQLLREMLEREADISVVGVALRGDDALNSFPDSGADVLLCELLLPGLDGLSLLRTLRERGALPHAVILSGFFNDSVARSAGVLADNYLLKPCPVQELLRSLRNCVLDPSTGAVHFGGAAVRRALHAACVMPHMDGYRYLLSALGRTWADGALLRGVTKSLYRDVAREFGTTPACVERSMRAAIDRAWERLDEASRIRLFGPKLAARGKSPSNVPFLAAMTAWLEREGGLYSSRDF